ncbi:PAS domain-containing protein [Aliirhizobium smilacinae]|uniref:PAS domain-containing protein n=1 Tax=Aliirhizobium smilacinae TaxID=1395944 RepID=A0A5C4XF50_9HYPH|nr:PAS domain-containing protein [Rhizobium smilacinae]TNM62106.1 PAS domain-containing protein [Rhizobium smilacinae]
MRNTATQEIFNYWNGLRGSRPAPLRSEIDPSALRRFLPHLFIVNATLPANPTFALAGTRICELFDRELRGLDYASMWLGTEDETPTTILNHVLFYERPALLDIRLSHGEDDYAHDLLLMPMRSQGYRSDRVLGALVPRHSQLPFTALPIRGLAFEGWGFVKPDGTRPTVSADSHVSTAMPATFFRRLVGQKFTQPGR